MTTLDVPMSRDRMLDLLRLGPHSLRADRKIVARVVHEWGIALEFADEALKKDRVIVLLAVDNDWHAFKFAHPTLQADREIVLTAARQDAYALCYTNRSLLLDREFMLTVICENPEAFNHVQLPRDHAFLLDVLKTNGYALIYMEMAAKANRELVSMAVNQRRMSILCAKKTLRNDSSFDRVGRTQAKFLLRYCHLSEDIISLIVNYIEEETFYDISHLLRHRGFTDMYETFVRKL